MKARGDGLAFDLAQLDFCISPGDRASVRVNGALVDDWCALVLPTTSRFVCDTAYMRYVSGHLQSTSWGAATTACIGYALLS